MSKDKPPEFSKSAKRYLKQLERCEIPDVPPETDWMTDYAVRDAQIKLAGFSVITKPLVDKVDLLLKKFLGDKTLSVLEVCAGNAWWSKVLKDLGHYTMATDDYSWEREGPTKLRVAHPVMDFEAVEAASSSERYDLLVMAWPCDVVANDEKKANMAYDILRAWEDVKPGRPVLYIGEGPGGCCASDKFFAHFRVLEYIFPFNYTGIHEQLALGVYGKEEEDEDN